MISARGLSVTLGDRTILRGVDLEVPPGLVTVVVGPNGSGKTTLLRAIAGDLRHTGDVRINGRATAAMKAWEAAALRAVLPQQTTLAFPFTVREVVSLGMGGTPRSGPARERAERPERALRRVDLGGFAGRFYQELSGGEQQRVQLARVLCQVWEPTLDGVPRYLLLDEPSSSLDIRHQLLVVEIAREFAARGGGVLMILHDLNLAAICADRLVAMHEGQVAAFGAPVAVMTDALLERVFHHGLRVGVVPPAGIPFVLPQAAARPVSRVPAS